MPPNHLKYKYILFVFIIIICLYYYFYKPGLQLYVSGFRSAAETELFACCFVISLKSHKYNSSLMFLLCYSIDSCSSASYFIKWWGQNWPLQKVPTINGTCKGSTYRSLSVSVRGFFPLLYTIHIVTTTPTIRPPTTTTPKTPNIPPGGPCGIGFSAGEQKEREL